MGDDDDDDDEEENDDEDDDETFVGPSTRIKKTPETFTLTFTNLTWIEEMVDPFERYGVSNEGFAHILGQFLKVGKAEMKNVIFSSTTARKIRKKKRNRKNLDRASSDFDDKLAVGFDTKKVKMGSQQGGKLKEHVVVNVQGVSGPRSLGISIAPDGKGKTSANIDNKKIA